MITNIMGANNSIALDPQKIVAGVRKEAKEAASELSQYADSLAMVKAGGTLGMLNELNESHEALFENMNTYKKLSASKALEEGIENVKKNAEELSNENSANNFVELSGQNTTTSSQSSTELELAQSQMPNTEKIQIEVPTEEIDMQEIISMEDVTAEAMEELLDLYV